ncbi:SPOR domain-containing protein [Erythrobacter sp. YT30]|uniref:SPOR domain-containing protein n=1 Tax=Erythrobacter sp. YT30 TaxID=1735012 RepID=UPI001F282324|nr:SPOR domain-containing protein [Erythrobacter sp. YT30]
MKSIFHPNLAKTLSISALALTITFGLPIGDAEAQEMVSRPVVQSLGSEEVQDLGAALRRLARQPRDLSALLAAGRASLAVSDLDAAMGFYGRAEDIAPQDPRVKYGIASVFLQSGRPVQALRLYDQIAALGDVSGGIGIARDRGLAYDLVGDFSNAQKYYAQALAVRSDDSETRRRLAISQAISGNTSEFEKTLRPLLEKSDPAAFRARAFGLAILGEQSRAAAIVNEVMPRDMSSRLTPYLAYMPRLTRAQQAAAANLGIFPRAADIGREDPEIAQYQLNSNEVVADAAPASPPALASGADARLAPAGAPLGTQPQGQNSETDPAPPKQTGPTVVYSTSPSRVVPAAPQQTAVEEKPNVADAFADIGEKSGTRIARSDAVDLDTIDIPREQEAAPPPPPTPRRFWVQVATGRDVAALKFDWRRIKRQAPDILGPFEAHVTPWGEANRLLAGPVENAAKARAMVNDLKGKGLDTFTFTSPEGAEIEALD